MFKSKTYICRNCGTKNTPKKITKGNLLTELILYLLGIIPGILYTAWRKNNIYIACRNCGSKEVLPLDSTMGLKFEGELVQHETEIAYHDTPLSSPFKKLNASEAFYKMVGFILVFIFLLGGMSTISLNKIFGVLSIITAIVLALMLFGFPEKIGIKLRKKYKASILGLLIFLTLLSAAYYDNNSYTTPQEITTETVEVSESTKKEEVLNIPGYILLEKFRLINGNDYASVLISTYSKETPQEELSEAAILISEKEGVEELGLYSTEDAFKANFSDSYSQSHPGAIEEGYLGSVSNGIFIMP